MIHPFMYRKFVDVCETDEKIATVNRPFFHNVTELFKVGYRMNREKGKNDMSETIGLEQRRIKIGTVYKLSLWIFVLRHLNH
jgi:hypothetical protein